MMATYSRNMTVRIVPLASHDASDVLIGGSVAERLRLVAELSEMHWRLTGRPLPTYTRDTLPVVLVPLRASVVSMSAFALETSNNLERGPRSD